MELQVPGARLRYDVRGAGPVLLMIPGGTADAAVFGRLAPLLETAFTVVTYDPRGLGGSAIDDRGADIAVATQADDARRLLDAVGGGPAYVFGNSGGAVTGLELAARHGDRVRLLVAHEPPLLTLLDDAAARLAATEGVYATYRREGPAAAMGEFMVVAGMAAEPPAWQPPPAMLPALDLFLGHMLLEIVRYRPDFAALDPARIAVGVGTTSAGQVAHRGALALAGRLGVAASTFPGDHGGFMGEPEAFAAALHRLLAAA